ncbi:MAG: LLM class F420-dependent oxidoreductase [Mycobacteriaceae bacterium]
MDLRIFTEPQQGATYDELLRVAQASEELGFDAFFRSDHYLAMSGDGAPGPTDAWTTLAGLARETSRIRLGTLVTSATFRLPGPLAVTVAQVDAMSGGRVELGLGAGWFAAEHSAYGIPFPPLGERFDRLTEQLEVISGMWATPPGQRFSHAGRHYPVTDCPVLARPVQPRLPIIIGGGGARKTPALAVAHAAEFNAPFQTVEATGKLIERVRHVADGAGRDDLVYSVAQALCVGADDVEVNRRAAVLNREVDELAAHALAGSPAQVVDTLGRFATAGVSRVYLQVMDLHDLDQLEFVAAAVAPQL